MGGAFRQFVLPDREKAEGNRRGRGGRRYNNPEGQQTHWDERC